MLITLPLYLQKHIQKNTFWSLTLLKIINYRNNKIKLVNEPSISKIKYGKIGQFKVKKENGTGKSCQVLNAHHFLLNTMAQASFYYKQWLKICIRNENAQKTYALVVKRPSPKTHNSPRSIQQ